MNRRSLVPLLLAAALANSAVAHATDYGTYAYLKWHRTGSVWTLQPADGCTVPCSARGYQYDANTDQPIPGHQQGESWDCRYSLIVAKPPPPPSSGGPGAGQVAVFAAAALTDASNTVFAVYNAAPLPYVEVPGLENPPPCPTIPETGSWEDLLNIHITVGGHHFP